MSEQALWVSDCQLNGLVVAIEVLRVELDPEISVRSLVLVEQPNNVTWMILALQKTNYR